MQIPSVTFKNIANTQNKNNFWLNTTQPQPQPPVARPSAEEIPKTSKALMYLTSAVALASLGVSTVAVVRYGRLKKSVADVKKVSGQLQALETSLSNKLENAIDKINTQMAEQGKPRVGSRFTELVAGLLGLGTGVGVSEYIKNNKKSLTDQGFNNEEIESAQKTASEILDKSQTALQRAGHAEDIANSVRDNINMPLQEEISPVIKRYTKPYYGLQLLSVLDYEKKIDLNRTTEILEAINTAAAKRFTRNAQDTISEINNYRKNHPELKSIWAVTAEYSPMKTGGLGVVPVDLQDNFTKLGIDNPTFIPMYLKKNQSEFIETNGKFSYRYGKDKFELKKLAEISTKVFRNGNSQNEKIEYYATELPIKGSDKKKTLIFVKNSDYFNDGIYDSTVNAEETERFALFSKAVYNLAKVKVNQALNQTNSGVTDLKIFDEKSFEKLQAPASMILNDWHASSLAGLMRYRAPMEYNYKELEKKPYEALRDMPLLLIGHNLGSQGNTNGGKVTQTAKNKTTENVINTLYDDYAIAIAENAHSGIILDNDDMCNTILLKRSTDDKHFNHLFNGVALSDWFVPVSRNYTQEIINDPQKSGILYSLLQARKDSGTISGTINGLDKINVGMEAISKNNFVPGLTYEVYDKNTPIDEIMAKRAENKKRFYNAWVKPLLDGSKTAPEIIGDKKMITEEDFVNSPIISFAHRLTSQKGLEILKGAIFKLCDNWENEFPNKPMPIFITGGPPESTEELQHLYTLKNKELGKNKNRVDRVLALKGNMPNPAIMAASTYFCAPSTFEPCGLTQGESFAKGTPIIATATGGFVDTVVDGKTGFLAPEINEEAFYKTMVKALKMYFDDNDKYQQMVKNDLSVDFSWAQPNKQGPIYEYTDKFGFNRNTFEDITAPK